MNAPLRCGRIRYTNDLPAYAAFDLGAMIYPGALHADVPARLNAMLVAGELDVSPVSAFAWARHASELVLLPDLCIGARDEVLSVLLVSDKPPSLLDGATIYTTRESASGRNLLRVLLERRYGVHPQYVDCDDPLVRARDGHAALLIGDRAIDARFEMPGKAYDLGRLWHEWTGEDTVFAVWAARRDAYERDPDGLRACMRALSGAYAWSRAHMAAVVDLAQRVSPRAAGFYEGYYEKLNFTFDAAAQSGLMAFCRELQAIGALDDAPSTVPEALDVVAR